MTQRGFFPGIILVGMGIYFLFKQYNVPLFDDLFTWPSILIIIGFAFLLQGYQSDKTSIFPGVILIGLGVHFHALSFFAFWPDHWAVYPLIVGIAFILRYQKTKQGLLPGLLLLTISILGLFYDGIISWMGWIGKGIGWLETFWPIILIGVGLYLLFFKNR